MPTDVSYNEIVEKLPKDKGFEDMTTYFNSTCRHLFWLTLISLAHWLTSEIEDVETVCMDITVVGRPIKPFIYLGWLMWFVLCIIWQYICAFGHKGRVCRGVYGDSPFISESQSQGHFLYVLTVISLWILLFTILSGLCCMCKIKNVYPKIAAEPMIIFTKEFWHNEQI